MSCRIDELTSQQVAEKISEKPVLIIPVASLEPMAGELPLGTSQKVVSCIADEVASKTKTLVAPLLAYPYATPFKAFPGVTGSRWNSFATTVADLVRSAIGWGVEKVVFLDGGVTAAPHIHTGIKRYRRILPDDFDYTVVSWQNVPALRKELPLLFEGLTETWRSDAALAKLYGEITDTPVRSVEETPFPEKEPFQKWKKRGMDPQKLKNITPLMSFSNWSGVNENEKLLPVVIEAVVEELNRFTK